MKTRWNVSTCIVLFENVIKTRAESKVPCTRVRYVSDLGYVSKTQTRYTPSYDSQCNTLPVILKKGTFAGSRCKWEFLRIFRRFRQVLERCVTRAPIARANILEFFYENSEIFKFQEWEGHFSHYIPLCGRLFVQGDTLRVWVPWLRIRGWHGYVSKFLETFQPYSKDHLSKYWSWLMWRVCRRWRQSTNLAMVHKKVKFSHACTAERYVLLLHIQVLYQCTHWPSIHTAPFTLHKLVLKTKSLCVILNCRFPCFA